MHYFVSDIHLGAGTLVEQREVEKRFLDFLKQIEGDAETLFLVGDIFDFWFEYGQVVPKGFTRTLALESMRKGITVNCIAPGMIETDILKTIPEDIMKQKIDNCPAKRLGQPSEIASVASFLSSDDSSWVTGNCILVCGGTRMR